MRGKGYTETRKKLAQLSFEENAEIISTHFNFVLPAMRTLDKYRAPPTIHSGIQKHEALCAYEFAYYHRKSTTSLESPSHLLTFVTLKFDGKELNPGAEFIKNDIMGVQNDDGSPVTVAQLRREYASHRDDGEFINTIYEFQLVNSAEEFWIEDCGGKISSPLGVHYLNPNTKNQDHLHDVLKHFLRLKCSQCLAADEGCCSVHCANCFAARSVCSSCTDLGYSEYEWHWATRRCLRCQQANLYCNKFHFLILSSDMESMNMKAAAKIVDAGSASTAHHNSSDLHMLSPGRVWSCGDPEHVFKNVMKSSMNWILRDDTFFTFRMFKTLSRCSNADFRRRLMDCNSKRCIVAKDATCTSDLIRLVSIQNERILSDCGYIIYTAIPEMVCSNSCHTC